MLGGRTKFDPLAFPWWELYFYFPVLMCVMLDRYILEIERNLLEPTMGQSGIFFLSVNLPTS